MERDYTAPTFDSLSQLTCSNEEGLKKAVPRRVWPKVQMCYGKTREIKRERNFCKRATLSNLDKCNGGFEAQFSSKMQINPKFSATAAIDRLLRNPKMYIDVDMSLEVKWNTGLSVRAAGECKHTEKRYLPEFPEQIAIQCFFPGCVVVYIQGRADLKLDGNLVAGATAVHRTEFDVRGKIRFGVGENNPDLTYSSACNNRQNCIQYPIAKSGWRAEAFGEMWGQVGVKVGPVITVMVTPGLWASITPWVSAEASMYGGMRYANKGGDLAISDEMFNQYTISKTTCEEAVSIPLVKELYDTPATTDGQSSKTDATGQKKPQTDAKGSSNFQVMKGDEDNCFAAGFVLRAGVDLFGGLVPESLASKSQDGKNYIMDTICGKAEKKNRVLNDEEPSPFDQGFQDFLHPTESNSLIDNSELSTFNKCLKEAGLESSPDGQISSQMFRWFSPRKFCRWGVEKVFQKVSAVVKDVGTPLYCQDYTYFTSQSCANKVGCNADLQLFPPQTRPPPSICQ